LDRKGTNLKGYERGNHCSNLSQKYQAIDSEGTEGWLKYLQCRADWERVMEEIRKEEIGGMLKECWIEG
jgi:hypothetical protein